MAPEVGGTGPCVGLLELASIAAGLRTVDGLSKQATITLLQARAVSPGKYVILFEGPVEEVSSALTRGQEVGGEHLLDRLFIPNLEPTLLGLVQTAAGGGTARLAHDEPLDALGVIETLSIASTIRAADLASKQASLRLVALQLAVGIGGKSWVAFTGEVSDVEAGVDVGSADAEAAGLLVERVVIPRPHEHVAELLGAEPGTIARGNGVHGDGSGGGAGGAAGGGGAGAP